MEFDLSPDESIQSGILCDLGCGEKPYEIFCDKNIKYIGIDVDLNNKNVDIYSNVKKINLPDNYCDYCVSFCVLEHVDEPKKKISEMYRLLKHNGELFMHIPLHWEEHEQPFDFYRFTQFGIRYLLEDSGFSDIQIKPLNAMPAIVGIYFARFCSKIFLLKIFVPLINFFFSKWNDSVIKSGSFVDIITYEEEKKRSISNIVFLTQNSRITTIIIEVPFSQNLYSEYYKPINKNKF
jgi:SAM-dependent methyltransferase